MKQEPKKPRAALLLAAAALPFTPLLAQDAVTPTTPVIDTAPAPTAAPTVAATPAPTPTMEPVVNTEPSGNETPAPRAATTTPRVKAVATRPARARTPAPSRVEPVRAEAAPVAAPIIEPLTPPVAAVPAPAPAPVAEVPPVITPTETRQTNPALWIALLGGAVVLAAAALLWRRRRHSADDYVSDEYYDEASYADAPSMLEPEPGMMDPAPSMLDAAPAAVTPMAYEAEAPAEMAAAPAAINGRALLELSLRPLRAGIDQGDAVVEFELTLDNKGSGPARDVRVATWMFPAGSEGSEMEQMLIERPADAVLPEIGSGNAMQVETEANMPTSGLLQDALLPVVVAEARYTLDDGSEARTSASFAVGVPLGEELAHFAVDNPSGMHEDVEARQLGEPEMA